MKDWNDDERLTAYALGELEGAERADIERELAGDPEGRRALAELRGVAQALEGELKGEMAGAPGLSDAARAEIAARAGKARGGGARRWVRRAAVVCGVSVSTAAGILVWVRVQGEPIAPFTYQLFGEPGERASEHAGDSQLAARQFSPSGSRTLGEQLQGLGYLGGGGEGTTVDRNRIPTPTPGQIQMLHDLGYSGETYAPIVENAFVAVADDPLSTFSIDVDTASYANVRRFLNGGSLPPPDAVRIEELLNYFRYDDPAPEPGMPFSITAEVASAPWAPEHRLLRIGLRGTELPVYEPKEKNLVFLIDVSGSMDSPDKLPLLKRGLRLLVENLSARDRVALVVYAGSSGVALPSTPANRKADILEAIERLEPGGSTHGSQGIELAYWIAERNLAEGGVNRVILCTDGDFNVGVTGDDALVELIETKRKGGVSLSVLGFGTGNLQDAKMEALADHGNGNYAYVDSLDEARKVLVREMGATLETIAKDVKIQVAFDAASAQEFRLIGYENRVLEHADFADDQKDAGEIGAGHSVTALYEIVPAEGLEPGAHLGDVRLRFKAPEGAESRLVEVAVVDQGAQLAEASEDLRFAAAVAGFGMVLRGSEMVRGMGMGAVLELALGSAGGDPFGYRVEFVKLVEKAVEIGDGGGPGAGR